MRTKDRYQNIGNTEVIEILTWMRNETECGRKSTTLSTEP